MDDPATFTRYVNQEFAGNDLFFNSKSYKYERGRGIKYDTPTDGPFQVYWTNGNLRYEWYYKNGKRVDGISKSWYEHGTIKQTMTWKNEKRDGLYIWYSPNGSKVGQRNYKNGQRNGTWTYWYENGQEHMEGTYKDNKQNGLVTTWSRNGQEESEIHYKDGIKIDIYKDNKGE